MIFTSRNLYIYPENLVSLQGGGLRTPDEAGMKLGVNWGLVGA